MNDIQKQTLSKVPEVTLGFWVIKVAATTLPEAEQWPVELTV